ncbi:MAG: hypothetical protein IKT01_00640 [Eubacteriaceae bacterium]|nr:hypothetical protein [Eubacteriaceae bacterium]
MKTSLQAFENGLNQGYNDTTGENYESRSEDFRRLQEESRGMPYEKLQQNRSGSLGVDNDLYGRLSDVLRREVGAFVGSHSNSVGVLDNTNDFTVYTNIDGSLFHDVFEIVRSYLENGELVDFHGIKTTEEGIGYNDCQNCLADDGLSGFSITLKEDLISVYNISQKRGLTRAVATTVGIKPGRRIALFLINRPGCTS